jgi:hypothetical protein
MAARLYVSRSRHGNELALVCHHDECQEPTDTRTTTLRYTFAALGGVVVGQCPGQFAWSRGVVASASYYGPLDRRMPTCLLSAIDGSTKHRHARQKHFYTSTSSPRFLRVQDEERHRNISCSNSRAGQVSSQVPRLAGHDTPSNPAPVGRSAKADWAEEALRCCRPSHRQQPAQPSHPNPTRQPPRAHCNTSPDAPNCPSPTVAYD